MRKTQQPPEGETVHYEQQIESCGIIFKSCLFNSNKNVRVTAE